MLGPLLRGDRITLEPIRAENLDLFRSWLADPEITRYMLLTFPPSAKQEEEWYESMTGDRNSVHWSIVVDGRVIGNTALRSIDWINRNAMSGTFIGERSEWGKGYASETVRLRTAYAFEELFLERLETESFAVNTAMHRALEKVGYRRIGLRQRHFYRGGTWHDEVIFELLRDEWLALRG